MTIDAAASRRLVREFREHFLVSGQVAATAGGVREEIAASWRRSQLSGVAPDRLDVPYEPNQVNTESRLYRVATPVMERFAARLAGTPTGLFLADRVARGVQRWVGEPSLASRFDAVGAAIGFRFDEEIAGTNALGTTIELGRPVKITADEHWSEQLNGLTCAGAPIRNPLTRQIEGIVDLTCVKEHNADVLLALVLELAYQIEERFYLDTSVRERLLLQHFTSAARNSARPVMALSQAMILSNPAASRLARKIDQETLWDLAARAMHADRACTETITQGEATTLAHCIPIRDGGDVIGVTIELKRDRVQRSTRHEAVAELGGLVGRSMAWRSICQNVHAAAARKSPIAVGGEAGVGKVAVARAWCELCSGAEVTVLDATTEAVDGVDSWMAKAEATLVGGRALIVSHVERLSCAAAAALGGAVERVASPVLAFTVTAEPTPLPTWVASLFYRLGATNVDIGPLRHRREDILALTVHFAGGRDEAVCASEVFQVLMRLPWLRNAAELRHVIESARVVRPSGALQLEDLPQGIRSGARRRMLSTMEQAEVDAILQALDNASGNKVDAAADLGISRSTLYRKMRSYGLSLDRAAF